LAAIFGQQDYLKLNLNYMVPLLKYLAIFLSAISGALALLVDFKKDGKVTKYGWFSLCGIILSFLISAILQGVEINNNKKAAIDEQVKTQNILHEISRGIYNVDASNISFDFDAKINYNRKIFANYNNRVREAFKLFKDNQNALPPGTYRFNTVGKRTTELLGFIIKPNSPLFPDKKNDKELYEIMGEMALQISIYKYDNIKSFDNPLSQNANLSFTTEKISPELTYWFNDSIIEIHNGGLKPQMDGYSWRNHGGIESLPDLQNGIITLSLNGNQDLDKEGQDVEKNIKIYGFSFNVRNRKFASFQLCTISSEFPSYYLKLPASTIETHLNIECIK
jgi:hypothetical protein